MDLLLPKVRVDMSHCGRTYLNPLNTAELWANIGFDPKGSQVYPPYEPTLEWCECCTQAQYDAIIAAMKSVFDTSFISWPCLRITAVLWMVPLIVMFIILIAGNVDNFDGEPFTHIVVACIVAAVLLLTLPRFVRRLLTAKFTEQVNAELAQARGNINVRMQMLHYAQLSPSQSTWVDSHGVPLTMRRGGYAYGPPVGYNLVFTCGTAVTVWPPEQVVTMETIVGTPVEMASRQAGPNMEEDSN